MNRGQKTFPRGRTSTVAILVCFFAASLLATLLRADSSSTNSVAGWPFTRLTEITPPQVRHAGWVTNGIDRFIQAALEQKGLSPAPAASARTLVRRLYFDLIGLPPSPAETDAFVNDCDPRAHE